MLPQLFKDIFENDGHGPLFRKDKMPPCEGGGEGIPLLSLLWEASSLDKPGFLRANVNHGRLLRDSFPEAFAEIKRRYDAGDTGVVTGAEWLAEFESTGMCAKFSVGESGFRIPFFGVNRASLAVAGGSFGAGDFRRDQMRPITGEVFVPKGTIANSGSGSALFGADYPTDPVHNSTAWSSATAQRLAINSAALGSNYSGDITHGPIIGATPFIKMYGVVTESSDANMAALITATTALNGRVEALERSFQVMHVCDEKVGNTNGGTFVANAWRTRDLNYAIHNSIPGAFLSNNQITLPAGTYILEGYAPAYAVGCAFAGFYNATADAMFSWGPTVYNNVNSTASILNFVHGWASFSQQTVVELRHYCTTTKGTNGFGDATGFSNGKFSEVFIRRIS